jgi:hypothetical protein
MAAATPGIAPAVITASASIVVTVVSAQLRGLYGPLFGLRDLAQGRTVAQVADRSGYSERMMFRLLRDLYTELGVTNRTEAMLLARERGWM